MATQTGSIDLTASNGVKLMAEAGFTNAERTYATKSALGVQADRISMVVQNSDASGDLTLTADALEYIGDHVVIKGTDGTSTVISGGQIQTGSLSIGAFDSAAQSATLNSNISVGGRNLFRLSDSVAGYLDGPAGGIVGQSYHERTTEYIPVEANTEYVLQAWYDTSNPTSSYEWVCLVWFDSNKSNGTQAVREHMTGVNYMSWSLTSPSNAAYVRVSSRWVDTGYMYAKVKLERGNKATDWSPAPEDVDSAISNAAKTATSYVTDIDSNGITVHPSRSDYATNGGRAVINGNGLTVYLGSDDVASYGASARIGKANSDRVTVDSTNGITIYKGNSKRLQTTANGIDVYGSDGTTNVARFGSTTSVGKLTGSHVLISDNKFSMSAADAGEALVIKTEEEVIPESSSSTGQEQIAYGVRFTDANNLSFMSMSPATAFDSNGKLYYTSKLDLYLVFDSVSIEGGMAYIQDGLQVSEGANISDGATVNGGLTINDGGATITGDVECKDGLQVNKDVLAYGKITGAYQLVADGEVNDIALRANTAGNRGLYDVTNDEWILYKNTSDELVFYNPVHLYSNTCTVNSTNASIYNSINYCCHNYAVATITIAVKLKSSLASGSTVLVATAPENYRPPVSVVGSVYITGAAASAMAIIGTGGGITLNNRSGSSISTSAQIYVTFTFAL